MKNGMVSDKSYVLHLFAGSGGGVLGSILLGEEIVGAVEWEKYPRETLLARQRDGILPEFPIWDDVTTFRLDNPETEEYIRFLIGIRENLTIAGGFPCHDISIAGKGAGIEGSRSGLWGEMCRIIAEIRPRYILLENSPMLIVRGFERVITDLAEIRYCLAWSVMGASDVGANHQRDRFWGLGIAEEYLDRERDSHSDSDSDRCIRLVRGGRSCETEDNFRGVSLARLVEQEPHKMWPEKMNGGGYNLSDTCGIRSQTRVSESEQRQEGDTEESDNGCDREKFPTPTTRDYKGSNSKEHIERGNHIRQLANYVKYGIEGGVRYPTPRTRDRGGTEAGLVRKDGKDRLDQLSNFIKFKVEKKMEDSGVFGCEYEWNSEGIPVTPGGTGERDGDR